eukprot:5626649-Alexandrium_andersonii.AAC.1
MDSGHKMVMATLGLPLGISRAHATLQHRDKGFKVSSMYSNLNPLSRVWVDNIQRQFPVKPLPHLPALRLCSPEVQLPVMLAHQESDLHLIVKLDKTSEGPNVQF